MARAPREKVLTEVEAAVLRDRILEAGLTPEQADRAIVALDGRGAKHQHEELLSIMPVQTNSDWGPQPIVCRWCGCWLEYGDSSEGRPVELHRADCFAVKQLGRPARPPEPERTPPRAHTIRRPR